MRARRWAAAAVATALTLSACAGTGATGRVAGSTPPAARGTSTTPTAPTGAASRLTPTPTATGQPTTTGQPTATGQPTPSAAVDDPRTLTLAFGGDVHFEDYLRPLARDPHGLDALRGTLGAADLSLVNLETAITERGTKIGKEFHFRAPATALDTLASAGVDAVSMANNHGVDFGPVGLGDTLAAKKRSPIPIVGIGADQREAFAPATLQAKGVRIAVFGASQVSEMTLANWSAGAHSPGIASSAPTTRIVAAVKRARKTHDLVIVFLHWGLDYQLCPDGQSVDTAQALERAGADIVVGGHSHRVNGAGWLGRAYVGYGLGNFVWWRSHEPDSRSGVLTLSVDVAKATAATRPAGPVVRRAAWTPMLIGSTGIPAPATGGDATRLLGQWRQAGRCAKLATAPGR